LLALFGKCIGCLNDLSSVTVDSENELCYTRFDILNIMLNSVLYFCIHVDILASNLMHSSACLTDKKIIACPAIHEEFTCLKVSYIS
jgi:hypothetical protein